MTLVCKVKPAYFTLLWYVAAGISHLFEMQKQMKLLSTTALVHCSNRML